MLSQILSKLYSTLFILTVIIITTLIKIKIDLKYQNSEI